MIVYNPHIIVIIIFSFCVREERLLHEENRPSWIGKLKRKRTPTIHIPTL